MRSVTTIWPRLRPHRRPQADHRRQGALPHCRRRARPCRLPTSPFAVVSRKPPCSIGDRRSRHVLGSSPRRAARIAVCSARKSPQRIHVAVERTEAAAATSGPMFGSMRWRPRRDRGIRTGSARRRLVMQSVQVERAGLELLSAESQMEAAGALEADVESRLALSSPANCCQAEDERTVQPMYSGMPRPLLCTQTSAKLPREARLAISPSSSSDDALLRARQSPGDGSADQAAANHRHIVVALHPRSLSLPCPWPDQ